MQGKINNSQFRVQKLSASVFLEILGGGGGGGVLP